MTMTFRLSDLYLIEKEKLSIVLLYTGMFIAFLGSLNPWFMWSIGNYYPILASMFVVSSYLVSSTMTKPIFTRSDFLLPFMAFLLFAVYERFSVESNINGYLMLLFKASVFYSLFRLDTEILQEMITFICKAMACLLVPSLFWHCLYLLGFPLPYTNAQFGEFYSFLVADIDLFLLFPRLCSYFLEPSHIGTACAFLLFAQRGQWRKWYNVVLLTTIFFTFSLASYIYLIAIMFFNSWTEGKQVVRKLIIVVVVLILGVVATFTYNDGNNMVHDLIALRLEVDDGEMAGDNRVTGGFEADFDSYMESSDIIFGRKYEVTGFGNAGYRVFFYDHGIIGTLLLLLFYIVSMMYTPNKRAIIAVLFVAVLYFWVSAFMLWENIYLPLYAAAYLEETATNPKIDI